MVFYYGNPYSTVVTPTYYVPCLKCRLKPKIFFLFVGDTERPPSSTNKNIKNGGKKSVDKRPTSSHGNR